MAAKVLSSKLRPEHGDEHIICRSSLGATMHIYVPVHAPDDRQKHIDEVLALLNSNDAAIIAYAKQHKLDEPTEVTE